jgi:hypothetical protein
MANLSKIAKALVEGRTPGRSTAATRARAPTDPLVDETTVETRCLVADYRVTHSVEVDKDGAVRRVLCGSTRPQEVAWFRQYDVPTCSKCLHIDAQPVAVPQSSSRWFGLEMRRIAADPVERARAALEAREKAEQAVREEAARAAAAAAKEERVRIRDLQEEAAALCAIDPRDATAAQVLRVDELFETLNPLHHYGLVQWRADAVRALARGPAGHRVETRPIRRPAEQPKPEHRPSAVQTMPGTTLRGLAMPRTTADGAGTQDRVSTEVRSRASAATPARGGEQTREITLQIAHATTPLAKPPADPEVRKGALARLLRAGPWPRAMLGKELVQALSGASDLPPGAIEALHDLVGGACSDAVQVGRALRWAATQLPMHGMRLTCRKDRDKFSWWQVVRA